jgi:hypothetical protein
MRLRNLIMKEDVRPGRMQQEKHRSNGKSGCIDYAMDSIVLFSINVHEMMAS